MISRKGKYIPGKVYTYTKEKFIKNGKLRVFWYLFQVKELPSLLIMTNQRAIWDVKFVSKNCGMTCQEKLSYWN